MVTEWHKFMGKWKQFSGHIKKRWGGLTNDERLKSNGNREILAGTLQERFGVIKLEAKKQADERANSLNA